MRYRRLGHRLGSAARRCPEQSVLRHHLLLAGARREQHWQPRQPVNGTHSPRLREYVPVDFAKIGGVLAEPVEQPMSKLTMTWEVPATALTTSSTALTRHLTASRPSSGTTLAWLPRLRSAICCSTPPTTGRSRALANYDAVHHHYTYADAGRLVGSNHHPHLQQASTPLTKVPCHLHTPSLWTWEATPEALSYEYCYDTSINDLADSMRKNATGTRPARKKLSAGDYEWQVRACLAQGAPLTMNTPTAAIGGSSPCFPRAPGHPVQGQPAQWCGRPGDFCDAAPGRPPRSSAATAYCYFPIDDTDTTPIADDDTCTGTENWVGDTSNLSNYLRFG